METTMWMALKELELAEKELAEKESEKDIFTFEGKEYRKSEGWYIESGERNIFSELEEDDAVFMPYSNLRKKGETKIYDRI